MKDVGSTGESTDLSFSDQPNSVGNYTLFPVGKHKIEIVVGGKTLDPIALQNESDSFHTLIVTDVSGKIETSLVADTKPEGDTGRLRFYNFANKKAASISVAGAAAVILEPGTSKEFVVPKSKKFRASIKVDLGNGTFAQSDTDIEPVPSGATSFVVMPDAYGRFRPRFYVDALSTVD